MLIRHTITPLNEKQIKIAYVNEYHKKRTTGIVLYDTYKITLYMSDDLASIVNNTVLNTVAGDIIFYRPDEINHGRFMKDGNFEYLEFLIPTDIFDDFTFSKEITCFFNDREKNRINIISPDNLHRKEILLYARRIADILKAEPNLKTAELFSLILNVTLICAKLYNRQKQNFVDNVPSFVSKTLSFITKHFAEEISLKVLAENCGCSVTYLSNVFKNYTGISVYNHLTAVRISMAKQYLKSGMSVTETAFSCGFNDTSNFIRNFKKITGVTPYKYKKEL